MNLLLSLFLACSNPYQEALDVGTVEAYEAFWLKIHMCLI